MDKLKKITGSVGGNKLFTGSILMFAGAMVGNVAAYLFHLTVGRILGPSGYGELSSLISVLYLLTVATTVVQTVLTKYFSANKAVGSDGKSLDLLRRATSLALKILGVGVVPALFLSPVLSSYLHINSWFEIALVYLVVVFTTLSAINISAVSGYQLFFWVSFLSAIVSVLRLGSGYFLAGLGVTAVLWGYVGSTALTYVFSFSPIRFLEKGRRERMAVTKKDFLSTGTGVLFLLLSMTSLYSTDIVLVRHFMSEREAGWYAAIAILGKIIYYASFAVSQVVLPVVAEKEARGESSRRLVWMAAGMVAAVSVGCLAIYGFAPGFVVHLLFGSQYDGIAGYLFPFGIFMTVYSLANIFIMAGIGASRTGIWRLAACLAVTQVIVIALFHSSLASVIAVDCICATILMIGAAWYYSVAAVPEKPAVRKNKI